MANGPPVGKRNVTFVQGHYEAVGSSAHKIADLLIKESEIIKEKSDEPQGDKKGKKRKEGKKKKPRLEILDFR